MSKVVVCADCGELRSCLPLETVRCWKCQTKLCFEPSEYEPPPACMDGVRVMRVAERTDGKFGMFFCTAESNVEVFVAASFTDWGESPNLVVTPLWQTHVAKYS